jgi:hypothetical protein
VLEQLEQPVQALLEPALEQLAQELVRPWERLGLEPWALREQEP